MPTQTYKAHRHNPKLTSMGFLFLMLAIIAFVLRWFGVGGRVSFAVGLAGLIASILVLLSISRVYTTKLQDRIIKLEMKVRCATLLPPAQHVTLMRLSTPQLVALRFAPDDELPALLDRADREHLTPDQIKQSIKNWLPDWDRT
jgi:Family of unknown function (DUF6526)